MKFYEKLSNGNRVFQCGRTDRRTDGRTDSHEELIVAFRNYATAPKKAV